MKQEFVKTAAEYEEDSFMQRKDSNVTRNCGSPTEFTFGGFTQQRSMFEQRKPISFIKTRFADDQESEPESDLIREFKKYQKKED